MACLPRYLVRRFLRQLSIETPRNRHVLQKLPNAMPYIQFHPCVSRLLLAAHFAKDCTLRQTLSNSSRLSRSPLLAVSMNSCDGDGPSSAMFKNTADAQNDKITARNWRFKRRARKAGASRIVAETLSQSTHFLTSCRVFVSSAMSART